MTASGISSACRAWRAGCKRDSPDCSIVWPSIAEWNTHACHRTWTRDRIAKVDLRTRGQSRRTAGGRHLDDVRAYRSHSRRWGEPVEKGARLVELDHGVSGSTPDRVAILAP